MQKFIYFLFFIVIFSSSNLFAQSKSKVGLVLDKDEYSDFMIVTHIEPYTPAFKSAIQQDDIILAIDGKDTRNHSPQEVMSWLEGEVGTETKVLVKAGKREYTVTLKRISRGGATETPKENLPNEKVSMPAEPEIVEIGTCGNVQKILKEVLSHFQNIKDAEIEAEKKWKSKVSLLGNAVPVIYKEGEKDIFEQTIFESKEKNAADAAEMMFLMELEGCQSCLKKYTHTNKKDAEKEEDSWYNGAVMLKVTREKTADLWTVKVTIFELSGY